MTRLHISDKGVAEYWGGPEQCENCRSTGALSLDLLRWLIEQEEIKRKNSCFIFIEPFSGK